MLAGRLWWLVALATCAEITLDEAMQAAVDMINYERGGSRAEGEALLQRVTEEHPAYAPPHFMLGLLRQQDGGPAGSAAAEAYYRRTLELEPAHVDARNNLGKLHTEAGDAAVAESHFRAALAIDAGHRMARLNLGLSLHGRGQFDAATVEYERYLSAHPLDADFLYNAAVSYQHAGQVVEAFNAYTRTLEVAPDRVDARLNHAALHHKHGHLEMAVSECVGRRDCAKSYASAQRRAPCRARAQVPRHRGADRRPGLARDAAQQPRHRVAAARGDARVDRGASHRARSAERGRSGSRWRYASVLWLLLSWAPARSFTGTPLAAFCPARSRSATGLPRRLGAADARRYFQGAQSDV